MAPTRVLRTSLAGLELAEDSHVDEGTLRDQPLADLQGALQGDQAKTGDGVADGTEDLPEPGLKSGVRFNRRHKKSSSRLQVLQELFPCPDVSFKQESSAPGAVFGELHHRVHL
jgi:hypothetical protein